MPSVLVHKMHSTITIPTGMGLVHSCRHSQGRPMGPVSPTVGSPIVHRFRRIVCLIIYAYIDGKHRVAMLSISSTMSNNQWHPTSRWEASRV